MKWLHRALVASVCAFHTVSVFAYEWSTHAVVTQAAFQKSYLGSSAVIFASLGLGDGTRSLGHSYFDIDAEGKAWLRFPVNQFENSIFLSAQSFIPATDQTGASGWMLRGVIREDDTNFDKRNPTSNTPQDEPGGNFVRVFAHFFDPQNNRPLTDVKLTLVPPYITSGPLGPTAPDWLLSPSATIPVTAAVNPVEGHNHFGVTQAREAMWRALTLTARQTDGTLQTISPSTPLSTFDRSLSVVYDSETLRNVYWATTFRALGDMVHLLEDMAQPQHTRNDAHAGLLCNFSGGCVAGHGSFYESYIDARAQNLSAFTVTEGWLKKDNQTTRPVPTRGLTLDTPAGYPLVRLRSYREYFDVPTGAGFGAGLADFSSLNFFTAGTNLQSDAAVQKYPSPAPTGQNLSSITIDGDANMFGDPLPAPIQYFKGSVVDYLVPTASDGNVLLSSYGAFNAFMDPSRPSYVLNYHNYDDQQRLLVPRAVAYSAGLMDYFFRGHLQISLPDEGVYGVVDHAIDSGNHPTLGGFRTIKLKVQNVSHIDPSDPNSALEPIAEDSTGTFVLVAKFHRNNCYKADLSGEYGAPGMDWNTCRSKIEEIVTSEPASSVAGMNSGPKQLNFTFTTPVPISASDLFLQVVYRGPLGSEPDAVIAELKDISEPTYVYNYVSWDQFMYWAWPAVDPGDLTYAQWCNQGFPGDLAACNAALGMTFKGKYSASTAPIPNYDPATSPFAQNTWYNMDANPPYAPEPPLSPVIKMTSNVGQLTRVAVLLDVAPTNLGLLVSEKIDVPHSIAGFQWRTQPPTPMINQVDASGTTLIPAVTYIRGRGQYLPASEGPTVTAHAPQMQASDVPDLVLTPSVINF